MNNVGIIVLLGIAMLSGLTLIFGGLILLKKQILIKDSKSGEINEVELPIFGRIKTNYPSLIALFLGAFIIIVIIGKLPPLGNEDFLISGRFTAKNKSVFNNAKVVISPQKHLGDINDDGTFTLSVPKNATKTPYNAYVVYTNSNGDKDYNKATVKRVDNKRENYGELQFSLR